jgi:signal transduction histidine kinase
MVRRRVKRDYLGKSVAARSRELQTLKQRLKEREMLASLGLAVSKVAHEIGNPLHGMSACVQFLDRQTREQGIDRDLILDAMNHLSAEIGRLETLLQELHSLGRPLKVKPVPVNMATLAGEVLQQSFVTNAAQSIDIRSELPEDLTPAMADPEKLKQVILNIVKNAIEAMPDGGILTLRAFRSKQKICLEIGDTGAGIPPEIQVFDCFATSKPNGWGLGLSIARQIISAHQGTIDYSTNLGKGTTFKVSLRTAGSRSSDRAPSTKVFTSFATV